MIHVVIENGVEQEITVEQSIKLEQANLIYKCDECTVRVNEDGIEPAETIYHIHPNQNTEDVDVLIARLEGKGK